MKRIGLPLSLLIVVLWAALQPPEVLSFSAPFMVMRKALTPLIGALAFGWMGFSMLLALRPAWLERSLGGLDKLFKVHKWAGISAVLLVVAHWLLILSPRTLMAWGWIETVVRNKRPHGSGGASLIPLAKEMGEWSAWIMIIIGIVALLRFIPYGWFRKLHKAFPVAFLIGAFHSVVLLRDSMMSTPFGMLVIAIALGGSFVAVQSLIGLIGRGRRHSGKVSSITVTPSGIVDLQVKLAAGWPGHQAGQFVLLTLDRKEGAHPFSIVSDWTPEASLRFAIKPLGDYTRTLAERAHVGDVVTVEGPYGRFDFGDVAEDQVWIAGGIGIAPFVARLEALAAAGGTRGRIHFFYSVKDAVDASFPDGLEALCERAGVELHRNIDTVDGLIDVNDIAHFVSNARGVWFCGPTRWAKVLKSGLQERCGLLASSFHHELFEFR